MKRASLLAAACLFVACGGNSSTSTGTGGKAGLKTDAYWVILHEVGHAFALSDYYNWTGSKPSGAPS